MFSMMFKQRKNFENNIFWNAKHNLREKGLRLIYIFETWWILRFLISGSLCRGEHFKSLKKYFK